MASVLLLFLMVTLAVSAAASGYEQQQQQQQPAYTSSSGGQPQEQPQQHTGSGYEQQQQQPANPSSSSCKHKEWLGSDEIVGSCNGAQEALLDARDKCCNELGRCGKFICPAVKRVADSVPFLQGLCNKYDACSDEWNDETDGDDTTSREYDCKLANGDNKAEGCRAAVEVVTKKHNECFCNLAHAKKNSGGSFGVTEYADLIKKLFPRRN